VLDADRIGHVLLDQRPARERVAARFGNEVLIPGPPREAAASENSKAAQPKIDRAKLGAIVFADRRSLEALEAILHPMMRRTFEKAITRVARRRSAPLIVIDAAILLEAGWDDLCDWILFVEAPETLRRERLEAARGWTAEQIQSRESAQWPLTRKRGQADFVLTNDEGIETIESQVAALWPRFTKPSATRRRSSAPNETDAPEAAVSAAASPQRGPRVRSPRRPRGASARSGPSSKRRR